MSLPESSPYMGLQHASVTSLWVQAAVKASNIERIKKHTCEKCRSTTFYTVSELELTYLSCKCLGNVESSIGWYVAAALISMQPTSKSRQEMAARFGIDVTDTKWQAKVAKKLNLSLDLLYSLNQQNKLLTLQVLQCS